ncbi:hypothetical protein CEXT_360801 [Caerostris extrusa]|uniref:Uncharacterized protein n=1 Tax=Caerostris extrusa TaxID=172846 RepID=A0AAV4PF78_CAEEX|nr:hypothetical protein CEXT_360801 [Caerostris extrusa]
MLTVSLRVGDGGNYMQTIRLAAGWTEGGRLPPINGDCSLRSPGPLFRGGLFGNSLEKSSSSKCIFWVWWREMFPQCVLAGQAMNYTHYIRNTEERVAVAETRKDLIIRDLKVLSALVVVDRDKLLSEVWAQIPQIKFSLAKIVTNTPARLFSLGHCKYGTSKSPCQYSIFRTN